MPRGGRGGGGQVRGAETKRGTETGGFCGGGQGNRGWTEGPVSALWLPDAPNIMFNDINFLLNGPRFDSRCERGPAARRAPAQPQPPCASRKKYTRENNLASRARDEREKESERSRPRNKEGLARRDGRRDGYGAVKEPNHPADTSIFRFHSLGWGMLSASPFPSHRRVLLAK